MLLYARNVVQASAHEGARAASELGAGPLEARDVARDSIEGSAGGLVDDLRVEAAVSRTGEVSLVQVRVHALIGGVGPIPLPFPIETTASARRETRP